MVQTKLQFQAVLDQVFPEYKGVFGDLYPEISLRSFQSYPTAESALDAGVNNLLIGIVMHFHLIGRKKELMYSSQRQNATHFSQHFTQAF